MTPQPCPVCKCPVYRNARGQVLAHTRSTGERNRDYSEVQEPCPGSTKGARP